MTAMREESTNLRRAEEDREQALALLPDADTVLPPSVANAIAAPRRIVSYFNRRAMMKSGETPAALAVAWSARQSASSTSTSAVSADESVNSFDSAQSDTKLSVDYEDEEEQEDDNEDEEYSSDFCD